VRTGLLADLRCRERAQIVRSLLLVIASTGAVVLMTLLLPLLGALYLLPVPLVLAVAGRVPAAAATLLGLPLGFGALWLLALGG
jgi:hypothetical protein